MKTVKFILKLIIAYIIILLPFIIALECSAIVTGKY